MNRLTAFAQRFRRAVRLYGIAGAARRAAFVFSHRRSQAAPHEFDARYGVDTSGIVRLEGLRVRGNRDLGFRYQASEPDAVRQLLDDLSIRFEEFVFVDIGSGKGRVVLLAAQLPFKSVVGVEYCEDLHEVAVANMAAFPVAERVAGRVDLVCIDAASFDFPPEPLILYFYNPFLKPVMQAVMANVRESLARHPRPVYVIMTGDLTLADVVVEAGFRTLAEGAYVHTP
jgi:SAM-dependent methyltransferase